MKTLFEIVTQRIGVGKDVWLAGGALVRHLTGESIEDGDFDIWTRDPRAYGKVLKNLFYWDFEVTKATKWYVAFEGVVDGSNIRVQVMHANFNSLQKVLDDFDLNHCRVGYSGKVQYADRTVKADLEAKKLRRHKIAYPELEPIRLKKYQERGYTLVDGYEEVPVITDNSIKVQYAQ